MKKNGILTLLFAFIPGAGQMYQGYMKRGLPHGSVSYTKNISQQYKRYLLQGAPVRVY